MRRKDRWPAELLVLRHGESSGNVARDAAEAAGLSVIDIALRDMDVPLSERGVRQAQAVGGWLASPRHRPTVVIASPYVRAEQTARIALEAAGLDIPLHLDERLREREFGILDRLTRAGIRERYPEQAEARARVGKFYHRPPGGESWADVALRVRSFLDSVTREHAAERVLVVAHQVVVLVFRYVLEHLTEAELLAIDRQRELANCSITSFAADRRRGVHHMRLERYGEVVAVEQAGVPVTAEPDVPLAPR
jgi:broad specificity phosphatase PhoE